MNEPSTVRDVITRMRRTLGHIGRRDREAVLAGIEAILELSTRLHEATHVQTKPRTPAVTIQRVPELEPVEGAPV